MKLLNTNVWEMTFPRQKLEIASLATLIVVIMTFYALLLRPGVAWADDWAMYIQNALNLLHGERYSATGYIADPDLSIGPTAYPPLYPLMLALPIAIWGIDFDAIRYFQLIVWAVFLLFVFFLTRRRLSFPLSLLVVAAVGFSPFFFAFKDYITAEVLFLALLFITFVLAARFEEHAPRGDLSAMAGGWLGFMAALCIATRSIGLILLPMFACYDLLRFGRIRFATLIAIAIGTVGFFLQFMIGDFLKDYVLDIGASSRKDLGSIDIDLLTPGGLGQALMGAILVVGRRLGTAALEFSRFWGHGANADSVARITSIVFSMLAIYGFTKIRRREFLHCDVFAVLYAGALLALPPINADARIQMPLAPLFYMYVLLGVSSLRDRSGWMRRGAVAGVVALAILSYWHSYRNVNFRAPFDGIEATNYQDMFGYIQKNTNQNSAIIFDKPRTLALYTQRRAAAVYESRKGDRLLDYMHQIGAQYILFYDGWYGGLSRQDYVNDYLRNHAGEFELLHESGHFSLYKMKPDASVNGC